MVGKEYRRVCAAALLVLAMAGAGCARTPMKRQDGTAENTRLNKTGTTAPGGGSGVSGGPISNTGGGTVDPAATPPAGTGARAGMTDGGVTLHP